MSDVPKIKREIFEDAVLRAEYHQKVDKALALAEAYQGKQAQSEFLLAILTDIEGWLIEKFGAQHRSGGLPPGFEMEIIAEWCDEVQRRRSSIDDLLGISSAAHAQFLGSALRGVGEDLCQVQMDSVLLPPGEGPGILEGDGSNPMEEPVFQERVKDLLIALEGVGIYSDDVILIRGKLSGREMRQLSYVIIEIPKLGREILINDQVGEATFVIDGIMSRQYLATTTKRELQDNHPERVLRVVYRDKGYWLGEIMGFLLKDVEDTKDLKKLDVTEQEHFRRIIIAEYPTPEAWADMRWEKKEHKINNKGLIAIARLFGIMVGNPKSNGSVFLALGRAIYGSEHECLWPLTKEYVKKWFLEKYPLPEVWVNLSSEERLAIRIKRQTLRDVARLFGLTGDPACYKKDILALGREVYGDHHDCLNVLNKEFLKSKILEKYPDAKSWAAMKRQERENFAKNVNIDVGIKVVAAVFEIEGDAIKDINVFLRLGRVIYGEEHDCLRNMPINKKRKHVDFAQWSTEKAVEEVKKTYPTATKWRNMTTKEKNNFFEEVGISFIALCKIFNIAANINKGPRNNVLIFLELGRAIYGEEEECLREPTKEYFVNWFRKSNFDRGSFARMTLIELESFKINGYNLNAIAKSFGLPAKGARDKENLTALLKEIEKELGGKVTESQN